MEITFFHIQLLKAREKSIKNDFNSTKNILNEETITNFLLGRNKEAVKTANWQEYHFYIGVLTFVIWDFMEMGLNRSC